MPELVGDCPRCRAKRITFDLEADWFIGHEFGWQPHYEAFCACRACRRSTVFIVAASNPAAAEQLRGLGGPTRHGGTANDLVEILSVVRVTDEAVGAPEHVPQAIAEAFGEGATCITTSCFNAAACMFRLCLDLATKPLLPPDDAPDPDKRTRRELGRRLNWLFDAKALPESLRELSFCVKDDGNDGAHAGTLTKADAEDLLDFAVALLERLYTEPKRLQLAKERRLARRPGDKK